MLDEALAAAPDTALHGDRGSQTLAAGWPMASPRLQLGEKPHRKPGREMRLRVRSEQVGIAVKSRRNPGQVFQESPSSAQESATVEGVSLEAPCTTTDESGDRWYTLSQRSAGDTATGGGGEGRWELMGGTGKYAGVTGTCTYNTSYLTQDRVVTEGKCAWERR